MADTTLTRRGSARSTVLPERPAAEPLPKRVFGKTGEEVPILGLGTAPGGFGLPDDEAIGVIHAAIDHGITYLDTAPGYDRAQKQLGHVLRERRDDVFVVTKTFAATAEKALEILENSLKDLQTERVDLTFVHSVGSQDPDEILAKDGSLAGLREAQRRGWTRYVGFTAHHLPAKSARILESADVDGVMFAMNFADRYTYGFEETVLPLAVRQNAGVAAMKVFGGAPGMKYENPTKSLLHASGGANHEQALRYALALPGVAVAVVGMYSEDEIRENVAYARGYAPPGDADRTALETSGRELAARWKTHFGDAE